MSYYGYYNQPSFAQRIIAAFEAGRREREAEERKAREAEDRKLQQEFLQHQLRQLRLEDKIAARKEAAETYGFLQGTPGIEFPPTTDTSVPSASPTTADGFERVPTITAPIENVLRHPEITIPGIYGPDIKVRPLTSQEIEAKTFKQKVLEQAQKQAAREAELQMKQRYETTQVAPGHTVLQGGKPVYTAPAQRRMRELTINLNGRPTPARLDMDTGKVYIGDQEIQDVQVWRDPEKPQKPEKERLVAMRYSRDGKNYVKWVPESKVPVGQEFEAPTTNQSVFDQLLGQQPAANLEPGNGRKITTEIAARYLALAGNDPEKARQMAAQDGWVF